MQVGKGDTVNVLVGIALFLSFFLNPQPDVLSSPLFYPGVRKLTVRGPKYEKYQVNKGHRKIEQNVSSNDPCSIRVISG